MFLCMCCFLLQISHYVFVIYYPDSGNTKPEDSNYKVDILTRCVVNRDGVAKKSINFVPLKEPGEPAVVSVPLSQAMPLSAAIFWTRFSFFLLVLIMICFFNCLLSLEILLADIPISFFLSNVCCSLAHFHVHNQQINSLSSVRLIIPKDLLPLEVRENTLKKVLEVLSRFAKEGMPLLDPEEDMKV